MIPPGQEGRFTAKISWVKGKFHKRVRVQTNDPENETIILGLKGDVLPHIVVEPSRINLLGKGEETITSKIKIISGDGQAFKILKIDSTLKGIAYEIKEEKKGYRYSLLLKANLPPGRHLGTLIINTNHPKKRLLKISIFAFVKNKP